MYVSPFGVVHSDVELVSKGVLDAVYGKDRLKASEYRGGGFKHGAKKYVSATKTANDKQGKKDQFKMIGEGYGAGAAGAAAAGGSVYGARKVSESVGRKAAASVGVRHGAALRHIVGSTPGSGLKGKAGLAAIGAGAVAGTAGFLHGGKQFNNKTAPRVRANWKQQGLK